MNLTSKGPKTDSVITKLEVFFHIVLFYFYIFKTKTKDTAKHSPVTNITIKLTV